MDKPGKTLLKHEENLKMTAIWWPCNAKAFIIHSVQLRTSFRRHNCWRIQPSQDTYIRAVPKLPKHELDPWKQTRVITGIRLRAISSAGQPEVNCSWCLHTAYSNPTCLISNKSPKIQYPLKSTNIYVIYIYAMFTQRIKGKSAGAEMNPWAEKSRMRLVGWRRERSVCTAFRSQDCF